MALALYGCTAPAPESIVSLAHVGSIHVEENDSLFIGDFSSIGISPRPLRLFVPDEKVHRIAVVDSSGRIVRAFGSGGQAPGELWRPMAVAVMDDRVIVKESNRFSVFDTTGTFLRTFQLPEGIYSEDRWSLTPFDGRLYLGAVDAAQARTGTARATRDQNSIAAFDPLAVDVEMFGQFPELYQQGEYNNRWRHLDISDSGHLFVVYSLSPEIQIYDLKREGKPLLRSVTLEHPEYRMVEEEIPLQMPITEMQRVALETSATLSVRAVADSLVVLVFANLSPEYYERIGDDDAVAFHAVVATTSGRQLGTLDLPGPVQARDSQGRLYIRLSNVPDQREIGIYEVQID